MTQQVDAKYLLRRVMWTDARIHRIGARIPQSHKRTTRKRNKTYRTSKGKDLIFFWFDLCFKSCAFFTSVCVCVWACVWVKNQNIYVFGNSRMLIRLYPPCYFLHLLSLQTKTIIFWVFWKQPNAYSTVSNVHKNCSYSIHYAIFHRKFSQICYKYYYPYFYHDYYVTFPFLVLHTQRKTLKNLVCLRQNNNMCILCILIFECKLLPVSHI